MNLPRWILIAPCVCATLIISPCLHAQSAEPAGLRCKDAIAQPASEALSRQQGSSSGQVVQTVLAGVPAIVRMPGAVSKPPIILWHGFGPPASERALMDALPLDDVPAIKVYLGLPMFGSRAPPQGMSEIAERQSKDVAALVFAPVVIGAADELANVVRALVEAGCLAREEGIGLFGFSAGGASALLALADRKVNVKAAVTLNASTGLTASVRAFEHAMKQSYNWTADSRLLASRSDAVKRASDISAGAPPPALLIIHGQGDRMMPAQIASDLHQALVPHYKQADAESGLQLAIVPGLAHAWVGTEIGDDLRSDIAQWFRRYM